MKKTKLKSVFIILAVMLVIMAFSIPAFADSYYASDESGNTSVPSSIDSITVSKVDVDIPNTGDASKFTPNGNMTLIDDLLQMGGYITSSEEDEEIKSKQFLTVTSKNGNTFYIVIDRDGDKENVYFLNKVDEADLMALINDGEIEEVTCSCKDKCKDGKVNTECELCKVNLAECTATEPTTEPTTEDSTGGEEKTEGESSSKGGIVLLLVVALACSGFAIYYFKFRKGGKSSAPVPEQDADDGYESGYDEEEYEVEDNTDDIETEA